MKKDKIVQFVCFETKAESGTFISQWELYNDMVKVKQDVTLLEESAYKNKYRFISQHRYSPDEVQFVFKKGIRSTHIHEVEMKIKEIGGYSPIQSDFSNDSDTEESKILLFLNCNESELKFFRQLPDYHFLNIYQAFYESCNYSYILEYFIENKFAEQLIDTVKAQNRNAEIGMYKECYVLEK
jgi:hypothetical protein